MPALPLCIDQVYSDGNKSDYQSKCMELNKKCTYFTVFCPVFSLRTACVLRAPFTSFNNLSGKGKLYTTGFPAAQKNRWWEKLVSVAFSSDTSTERRDNHHCYCLFMIILSHPRQAFSFPTAFLPPTLQLLLWYENPTLKCT